MGLRSPEALLLTDAGHASRADAQRSNSAAVLTLRSSDRTVRWNALLGGIISILRFF